VSLTRLIINIHVAKDPGVYGGWVGTQFHIFWSIWGDGDPGVYGGGVQVHTFWGTGELLSICQAVWPLG